MYCAIIADDLSGANAMGAQLYKIGIQSLGLLDLDNLPASSYDEVLIYSTGTRNMAKDEAAAKVKVAASRMQVHTAACVSKRIDSTLRGNILAEVRALQGCLQDYCALIVPSLPDAGRICWEGEMLVHGIPLEKTGAANDPMFPIKTSKVAQILGLPGTAYLDGVGDVTSLAEEIEKRYSSGQREIIIGCRTNEQVSQIAKAAIKSGIPFLCVDPGPFTGAVIQYKKDMDKVLLVIGSTAATTRNQMADLKGKYHVGQAAISVQGILQGETSSATDAVAFLSQSGADVLMLYLDSIDPQYRVPFEPSQKGAAKQVNMALAKAAAKIIQSAPGIHTVICTGGDITLAVCEEMGITSIRIQDEIEPLVGMGTASPGDLRIISKGGMAGGLDIYGRCIEAARRRIE